MQAAGMGDAIRSSAVGHNALMVNPAAMSQVKAYQVTTGFAYGHEDEQAIPSVSFVDSLLNPLLAAGLGYSFRAANGFQGDGDRRREHMSRGAISSGFAGESIGFFLGVGLNWLNMGLKSGPADDYVTMDASALLVVQRMIRIAVVGHNAVAFTDRDPQADIPTSLGTGVSFMYGNFLVGFDTDTDFDTYKSPVASYHVGTQYAALGMIPLRVGFAMDPGEDAKRITGGLGYWTPAFMVDLGYQHNTESPGDFLVGIDLVFALN